MFGQGTVAATICARTAKAASRSKPSGSRPAWSERPSMVATMTAPMLSSRRRSSSEAAPSAVGSRMPDSRSVSSRYQAYSVGHADAEGGVDERVRCDAEEEDRGLGVLGQGAEPLDVGPDALLARRQVSDPGEEVDVGVVDGRVEDGLHEAGLAAEVAEHRVRRLSGLERHGLDGQRLVPAPDDQALRRQQDVPRRRRQRGDGVGDVEPGGGPSRAAACAAGRAAGVSRRWSSSGSPPSPRAHVAPGWGRV